MKFAHELKDALRREGFPPHWIESAVPYGQLKKSIKKVEGELKSFGLDAKTLAHLSQSCSRPDMQGFRRGSGASPVAFDYRFDEDSQAFHPKLTLYIRLEDGVAIDATLSADTRKYLEDLTTKSQRLIQNLERSSPQEETNQTQHIMESQYAGVNSFAGKPNESIIRQIEVPLTFDAEFFGILQGDVSILDLLQAGEQKVITDEIRALGSEISKVADPSNRRKSDIDQWRALFDIYLQAGVFFSTNELDHGSRNSAVALKQLQWFQHEATNRGLGKSFKMVASREAFKRFTRINLTLVRNIKFQEINQLAISKILKKFDKRTSLGAKNTFPRLIQSDRVMSEAMAKSVCAEVSREIIRIVPQLDDYLCPVCLSIAYKPVRLTCGHVFCIRCMVKMQRVNDRFCPLCRGNVLMEADSANLDTSLMNFLKKYFPKETKAKQKDNEMAVGIDKYGEQFANTKCIVM